MIPRTTLLPKYRHATQAERNTIREFIAGAREIAIAAMVLPVVLAIVALTRPRFMESEEECGDCRKPSLKCRCGGGE